MRALVQRVSRASVTVADEVTGEIGAGLLALVGVTHDDGVDHARALAAKLWHLRVFEGEDGRMDLPVGAVGGRSSSSASSRSTATPARAADRRGWPQRRRSTPSR